MYVYVQVLAALKKKKAFFTHQQQQRHDYMFVVVWFGTERASRLRAKPSQVRAHASHVNTAAAGEIYMYYDARDYVSIWCTF